MMATTPITAEIPGDVSPGVLLPRELAMETIGVRELKNNLSRVLKRIQAGARIAVTDRGKPIAILHPVEASPDLDAVYRMVAEGRASWSGGKPTFPRKRVKVKAGVDVAAMIREDRR
jgi:prevent-host-death family protein